MEENTRITAEPIQIAVVEILNDMKMILIFANGEKKLFDAKTLTGSAFKPLKNRKIFESCKIVDGVVTWLDETIDCAPEWMYLHSSEIDRCRKDNNQAFVLDPQKANVFLRQKSYTSTDAISRFEKRNQKGK